MTRRLQLLAVLVLLASCRTSSSPGPEPVPVAIPEPSSAPRVTTREQWILRPVSARHRFTSSVGTSIDLQDAAGILHDSLTSTVTYSLETQRSGESLSYSATVESISLRGGQRVTAATGSISPFSFTGRLEKNRLSIDSTFSDCSNDALSAIPVIQRSLAVLPLTLQKDMTWTDSVSSAVCSGSVPVVATAVRRYRVLGETPQGILLERQDRTSATGEGSQGQHRIRLKTDGTGTTQVTIDTQTGELVQSSGTSSTTVVVTSSGRDQKFIQTVRERINRI